ncbi:hypothetical protein MLD38_005694 [Melastoma candidum]|uniref:Uncharacterized protein n=1 Tax=Melastoma candidum TaxID=119954 RepID=A0ACB9RTX3_9MYRT|nr:hypothetical protein MLD38_005694 [Melastoma candidum]
MEEGIEVDAEAKQSVYNAARRIKQRENSLYNALRSIYEDSVFVSEISQLWSSLPLVANLRCGLWLNLHLALLAGQRGGCIVVDSTRKGKRFPDSMWKTILIWTCVLNRAITRNRRPLDHSDVSTTERNMDDLARGGSNRADALPEWDCSLHLPLWVSDTERAKIEGRLDDWTNELEASGADVASVAMSLRKPLRPLWISQRTVIWLTEVPDHKSWDFTSVILLSVSCSSGTPQPKMVSEFSWSRR